MSDDPATESLNIAICDDNPIILEKLRLLTEKTLSPKWEARIYCSTSPGELLNAADSIHIAVLDIELDKENGIVFARRLLQRNPDCRILFVSGYLRYVSDVYDVPHLGMVLKDQLELQLPRFLLRAAKEVCSDQEKVLAVPMKGKILKLNLSAILYLERQEHITCIRLASGQEIRTREKLDALLSQKCCRNLCRCHASYAVNLGKVKDLQGKDFVLTGGERIPISRGRMQSARAAYFAFLRCSV